MKFLLGLYSFLGTDLDLAEWSYLSGEILTDQYLKGEFGRHLDSNLNSRWRTLQIPMIFFFIQYQSWLGALENSKSSLKFIIYYSKLVVLDDKLEFDMVMKVFGTQSRFKKFFPFTRAFVLLNTRWIWPWSPLLPYYTTA